MLTSKNMYVPAERGEYAKRTSEEIKTEGIVKKLQDVQKLFLSGSEPYYKVQDIINELNTK